MSNTNPKIAWMGSKVNYIAFGGVAIVLLLAIREFISLGEYGFVPFLIVIILILFFLFRMFHKDDMYKYSSNKNRVYLSIDNNKNIFFNNSNKVPFSLKTIKSVYIVGQYCYFVNEGSKDYQITQELEKISDGLNWYRSLNMFLIGGRYDTARVCEPLYEHSKRKLKKFLKGRDVVMVYVYSTSFLERLLIDEGFIKKNFLLKQIILIQFLLILFLNKPYLPIHSFGKTE